jgi:hypothetical protein
MCVVLDIYKHMKYKYMEYARLQYNHFSLY